MNALVTIGPLEQAVQHFGQKSVVASTLTSAQWEALPIALRVRALFISRIEDVRFLATAQAKLKAAIGLQREAVKGGEAFVDRSSFIGDLKKLVTPLSNSPNPFADRGITNIASAARLGLIYDMQVQSAQGFARWKMDNDADVLDAYPAQELIREETRRVPRDWAAIWTAKGGTLIGDRMVALKTDRIWERISRFGTPWPPFDFGSGMGLRDVSRDEAESLGLIKPDAPIEPTAERDFNETLAAQIEDVPPEYRQRLAKIFGDRVEISGGTISWKAAA